MARLQTGLGVLALFVLLLVSTSCGPPDVNQLRGNYSAELNSWFKQEAPTAAEAMITVEGETEGEAGEATDDMAGEEGEAGEGDAGDKMPDEMSETINVAQKVTLDILLKHNGARELPVVTLDIYQADSEGNEKQNWKLPVDTSDLAVVKQITETLEGVALATGDQFAVEVRAFVPPEEWGEYEEFSTQPSP